MVTEDYVSFETAMLLKEKGFNERTNMPHIDDYQRLVCYIPTLQMATKWLQKALNILVIPNYEYECDDTPWCYKIFLLEEGGKPQRVPIKGVSYDKDNNPTEHTVGYRDYERSYEDYSTKEEAIEEGIKYCLKNLI